jgi:Na+-transporting NADH:ubiquinone oxidoreductase subunit NqrB
MAQAARYGFVWCPTDAIDRCIFRHPEQVFPTRPQQRRYVELTNRVRDWNAQLPLRNGSRWLGAKLGTLSWDLPTAPIVWLLLGGIGLVVRRPRGWPAMLVLAAAGLAVLFVHALSQEPQAEFSIPLTPMFALAAVAVLFGRRADSATVPE